MAHALSLSLDNPVLKANSKLSFHKGIFNYSIESKNGNAIYTVSDGTRALSLPIHWTAGQRMQTWIFEREGHYYESLVSYYPSIKGLETTIGDDRLTPSTVEEAVGREITPREVKDCFGCHSTNAVSKGRLTLDSMQPGVTCEHCHSGSSAHLFDAIRGVFDSAPPKLNNLSAEGINDFCGQCHRSWETGIRNGIRGEANVRFQPYRLENSKCFDGADSRMSCVACHDPHKPLVRDESAYDRNCLACHASSSTNSAGPKDSAIASCPVATSKCVSCHMPKVGVNSPAGLITFTDHQIRVVKPGEPYPN